MSNIYDGPGKARKQCPSCKKYIHARSTICPACNAELKAGAKEKLESRQKKSDTHAEGGRGLKQCPTCKVYVGVRTQVCECGNDFSKSAPIEKEKVKTPATREAEELMVAMGYFNRTIIFAPAGDCPIKPKEDTRDGIFKWCENVFNHYEADGKFVSPSCLRYLVSKVYTHNSDEYRNAIVWINEWKQGYLDSYVPIEADTWNELAEMV